MSRNTFALAAAFSLTATAIAAQASDDDSVTGTCVLSYLGKIYANGACEGTISDDALTDLSGTADGSGASWQLVIDGAAGTGVLIGADTFVLADGEILSNQGGASYVWQNGYALDFMMDGEN